MKKKKMMRIASVLLVAVLLSTCAISGTFAKYVTQVSGNDSARVAKWGITSDLRDISTFSTSYASGMVAVNPNETVNIVAPDTSDSGTYKISGAPEVAYTVTFSATNVKDIFLAAGIYDCGDNNVNERSVTANNNDGNYYPLKWTVTVTSANGSSGKKDSNGVDALVIGTQNEFATLADVAAAFANTVISYDANEECGLTIEIAWKWVFSGQGQSDDGDTVLANIAAETCETDADHSIDVAYKLDITITQVDTNDTGAGNNDNPTPAQS